jgi:hypothetical protein
MRLIVFFLFWGTGGKEELHRRVEVKEKRVNELNKR